MTPLGNKAGLSPRQNTANLSPQQVGLDRNDQLCFFRAVKQSSYSYPVSDTSLYRQFVANVGTSGCASTFCVFGNKDSRFVSVSYGSQPAFSVSLFSDVVFHLLFGFLKNICNIAVPFVMSYR
jgi:hypothetical protein